MPKMCIISTTAVPDHVEGALRRWMIEPMPGLFVGAISARIRDQLWELVAESVQDGAAVLIRSNKSEQNFLMETAGERRRSLDDFDGLTLVRFRGNQSDLQSDSAVPWLSRNDNVAKKTQVRE